ncbi:MAG: YceK/YidQ family lipoprotein [Planctomycetota bacterium]|jgi:uncharacterized protein YceK
MADRSLHKLTAAMLLAAATFLGGCATATTTVLRGPTPYSGTRTDVALITEAPTSRLTALPLLDLPLSFALDTALLPVSVPLKLAGITDD